MKWVKTKERPPKRHGDYVVLNTSSRNIREKMAHYAGEWYHVNSEDDKNVGSIRLEPEYWLEIEYPAKEKEDGKES